MLIPLTRAMAQGPMSPEREARLAEIERLTTVGLVAWRRLWKLLPDPENQAPILPPVPMKPGELRRLAARMRAGLVPEGTVPVSVEEVERVAVYQKRAIWAWRKMRSIEERLKPLWAAEEAECEKIEQAVFHETKSVVTADPDDSTNESFQTMKRAFRECSGRRRGARRKMGV
jgi:hypothetical protein